MSAPCCSGARAPKPCSTAARDNTYAYWRIADSGETVFVYLNNNPAPRNIPWADYAEITGSLKGPGRDVVSGETITFEPRTVAGRSALVVEYK